MTGLVKMFEVERISLNLAEIVSVKCGTTDLEFEYENEPVDNQYDVGSASHSRNYKLKEDVTVGEAGEFSLKQRDLCSPGVGLLVDQVLGMLRGNCANNRICGLTKELGDRSAVVGAPGITGVRKVIHL